MKATANTSNRTFGMSVDTVKIILMFLFFFTFTFSFSQCKCLTSGGICQDGNCGVPRQTACIAAGGTWLGNVANCPEPLPVELLEFNFNTNFFSWTTASELNNDYFTIEKSFDMENWSDIAQIESKVNSSNSHTRYQYEYDNMDLGTVYFRLTQVDFDGKTTSFDAIYITNKNLTGVDVFPNPSKTGIFMLNYSDNIVEFKVSNINGRIVESVSNSKNMLDLSNQNNGVYILAYTYADGNVKFERLVINK